MSKRADKPMIWVCVLNSILNIQVVGDYDLDDIVKTILGVLGHFDEED